MQQVTDLSPRRPFPRRLCRQLFKPDRRLTQRFLRRRQIRRYGVSLSEKLFCLRRVGYGPAKANAGDAGTFAETGQFADAFSHDSGGIDGPLSGEDKLSFRQAFRQLRITGEERETRLELRVRKTTQSKTKPARR